MYGAAAAGPELAFLKAPDRSRDLLEQPSSVEARTAPSPARSQWRRSLGLLQSLSATTDWLSPPLPRSVLGPPSHTWEEPQRTPVPDDSEGLESPTMEAAAPGCAASPARAALAPTVVAPPGPPGSADGDAAEATDTAVDVSAIELQAEDDEEDTEVEEVDDPVEEPEAEQRPQRLVVAVRVKPVVRTVDGLPDSTGVAVHGNRIVARVGERKRQFEYDYVFTGGQEVVFARLGRPMVEEAYKGYNVCLFAYGATGTGKSYSMYGGKTKPSRGVIPRLCRKIFSTAQAKLEEDASLTVAVTVQYVEVYNELVRDLLQDLDYKGEKLRNLELYKGCHNVTYIKGVTEHAVSDVETILSLVDLGNSRRQVSPTGRNDVSSRSHSILQIFLTQADERRRRQLRSAVTLVDLAGSERIDASEEIFTESRTINRSLLTLGRVLNFYATGNTGRVPFLRDSKLTRLLGHCFGGNARTYMLATIAPTSEQLRESLFTLDYAQNAKLIANVPVINRQKYRKPLDFSQKVRKRDSDSVSDADDEERYLELEAADPLICLEEATVVCPDAATAPCSGAVLDPALGYLPLHPPPRCPTCEAAARYGVDVDGLLEENRALRQQAAEADLAMADAQRALDAASKECHFYRTELEQLQKLNAALEARLESLTGLASGRDSPLSPSFLPPSMSTHRLRVELLREVALLQQQVHGADWPIATVAPPDASLSVGSVPEAPRNETPTPLPDYGSAAAAPVLDFVAPLAPAPALGALALWQPLAQRRPEASPRPAGAAGAAAPAPAAGAALNSTPGSAPATPRLAAEPSRATGGAANPAPRPGPGPQRQPLRQLQHPPPPVATPLAKARKGSWQAGLLPPAGASASAGRPASPTPRRSPSPGVIRSASPRAAPPPAAPPSYTASIQRRGPGSQAPPRLPAAVRSASPASARSGSPCRPRSPLRPLPAPTPHAPASRGASPAAPEGLKPKVPKSIEYARRPLADISN